MPIYFFDVSRGDHVEEDHVGRHLLDLDDAHEAAAVRAHELIFGGEDRDTVVEVRDDRGTVLARVPIARMARKEGAEDTGHPETTTGSGKFQQPVLRGDNRMHINPETQLPTSPEVQPLNGGSAGTAAQTPDLSRS